MHINSSYRTPFDFDTARLSRVAKGKTQNLFPFVKVMENVKVYPISLNDTTCITNPVTILNIITCHPVTVNYNHPQIRRSYFYSLATHKTYQMTELQAVH